MDELVPVEWLDKAIAERNETAAELATIRAERDALRADAERWRWVRSGFSAMSLNIDGMHAWTWRGYNTLACGPTIDIAVDAARAALAPKGE